MKLLERYGKIRDQLKKEKGNLTFLEWYKVLRGHRHWGVLDSIRYAWWLSR